MSERSITGAGVGVLVVRDGKVLLGLRNSDPAKADSELHGEGTWTMPGGKIRFGESFEQTASRELTEETTLAGSEFTFISVSNDVTADAHFITIGMLCTSFVGEVRVTEPDEIVEWRWFPLTKLPGNMFSPSRKITERYARTERYQANDR
jgi:ADP-ribose pyrophosphatase YjhB (NUDIX family)